MKLESRTPRVLRRGVWRPTVPAGLCGHEFPRASGVYSFALYGTIYASTALIASRLENKVVLLSEEVEPTVFASGGVAIYCLGCLLEENIRSLARSEHSPASAGEDPAHRIAYQRSNNTVGGLLTSESCPLVGRAGTPGQITVCRVNQASMRFRT